MNRLRRDDRGQVTTALVIVVTVVVVAMGMVAVKLGQATDQKSQVQSAADAAALAAAQQIRQGAPGRIDDALRDAVNDALKDGGGGRSGGRGRSDSDLGRPSATDFAFRAGADLVDYHYEPTSDTVHVWVESLTSSVAGSPDKAKAEAMARVGLALGDCVLSPLPTLVPTPTPTTTDSDSRDVEGIMRCGDLVIPIEFDGDSGEINSRLSHSDIRELLNDFPTPALKS